jgi:hypothetical protein
MSAVQSLIELARGKGISAPTYTGATSAPAGKTGSLQVTGSFDGKTFTGYGNTEAAAKINAASGLFAMF